MLASSLHVCHKPAHMYYGFDFKSNGECLVYMHCAGLT